MPFLLLAVEFDKRLRLVETSRFWCLFCERERSYQLREWSQNRLGVFLVIPWFTKERGRFVRCDECRETFDPECLDESSTKTRNQLTVSVPDFAWAPARVRPSSSPQAQGSSLAGYLGWDEAPPEVTGE